MLEPWAEISERLRRICTSTDASLIADCDFVELGLVLIVVYGRAISRVACAQCVQECARTRCSVEWMGVWCRLTPANVKEPAGQVDLVRVTKRQRCRFDLENRSPVRDE